MMEEAQLPLPELRRWLQATPLMRSIWCELGRPSGRLEDWAEQLLQDMLSGGVLVLRDGIVHDR
jgi:hypothetical protein